MQYNDLSEAQIKEHEKQLIDRADDFWVKTYGREEATDIEKLRLLSRQGKIQDKFQHDIMVHYFKKQGFWSDGKTTLQEREKQLILKKTEFGQKINRVKTSKIADMDIIIQKAEKKKRELEKIPTQMKEEFKIDKQKILSTLRQDLQSFYDTSKNYIEKEISEVFNDFIKKVETQQNELLDNARAKIHDLQRKQKVRLEREIEQFGSELEAELTVLDYKENDEQLIQQYNEEIKKINQELNEIQEPVVESKETIEETEEEIVSKDNEDNQEIPIGLENLTVRQLKALADRNGIEYNAHILKAELIEKLS